MHTGYTGTMFCADPDRRLITVLMTNRVYPSDAPGYLPVQTARREFNDAVLSLLEYRPEAQKAPLFKQCNATYGSNLMMNETICNVWHFWTFCCFIFWFMSLYLCASFQSGFLAHPDSPFLGRHGVRLGNPRTP